jgi:hypothetical protein
MPTGPAPLTRSKRLLGRRHAERGPALLKSRLQVTSPGGRGMQRSEGLLWLRV